MADRWARRAAVAVVAVGLAAVGCDGGGSGGGDASSSGAASTTSSSTPAPVGSPDPAGPAAPTPPYDRSPTTGAPTGTPSGIRLAAVELASEDPMVGGQYVLVVNGTAESIDIGCWGVRSATTGATATVAADEPIAPGGSYRLIAEERGLFDSRDTLTLLDRTGREVDRTPALDDPAGDDQLWFLSDDGSWTFGRGFAWPGDVEDGDLQVRSTNC